MSLEEIYEEAIRMKKGERKIFLLDKAPARGEIATLCVRLTKGNEENLVFSFVRNGLELKVHCYKSGYKSD